MCTADTGPEQCLAVDVTLASTLSENPVPSHLGEENASSLGSSVLDTASLSGTLIGALTTRDVNLFAWLSDASCVWYRAAVPDAFAASMPSKLS